VEQQTIRSTDHQSNTTRTFTVLRRAESKLPRSKVIYDDTLLIKYITLCSKKFLRHEILRVGHWAMSCLCSRVKIVYVVDRFIRYYMASG